MPETVSPQSVKNPWLAFILSVLFPGLGQLYAGNRSSALIYAVMGAGIWISCLSSGSWIGRAAALLILPFVIIPSGRDAFETALGRKKPVTGDENVWYVIWMLCCVGPFALPLLWRNKKLSFTVKVMWTFIVIGVAVFFLWFIAWFGKTTNELFGI